MFSDKRGYHKIGVFVFFTDFSLELSITVIFRVMEGLCRRDGSRGWIKIKLFLLFNYYLIGVIQYKELS